MLLHLPAAPCFYAIPSHEGIAFQLFHKRMRLRNVATTAKPAHTDTPPFFSINHSRLYTLQAYIKKTSFYFAPHRTVAHPHNHTMIVLCPQSCYVFSVLTCITNIYKYRVHQICAFWWPGFEYLDSSSPSTFFRCSATLLCTGGRFIMVWRILKNKRYLSISYLFLKAKCQFYHLE